MALYGVLGDIHGNREALAAALALLAAHGAERLLCVGDIVGYNAEPDACVALLRERGALAVAGNHDLIALGRLQTRRCSGKARHALERTRRGLSSASAAYLAELPASRVIEGSIALVHGGVRDVEQYMRGVERVSENAAHLRSDFPGVRMCLFGHVHEQLLYEVEETAVHEQEAAGTVRLAADRLHFVSPGSVDASRKRGPKLAECALLDTGQWTVTFLRRTYDAALAERKAAAGGYRIGPWAERLDSIRRRFAGAR
jgi:predicted phosphodiesterase